MATDPNASPSRDPADDGSLQGTFRLVLDKFLQGVDDCLPARVLSYDRPSNRAQVLPIVKLLTTDGRKLGRAPVASIPVLQLGGGGFVLSFPIKVGDLGWIKATDRDISLILQAYADDAPNTLRKHSFEDAVFIPDVMHNYTIAGEDATNVVLQSLDGTIKVAVASDHVKVAAGSSNFVMNAAGTTFTGPVEFKNAVTMDQTLGVTGNVALAAQLAVTGASTLTGAVGMPGGATINTIPFGTHKHTGVSTGSGTSGGPTS